MSSLPAAWHVRSKREGTLYERKGVRRCDSACCDQYCVRICQPGGTSAGHMWVEDDEGLPKTWVQVECGISMHDVKK